MNLEQQVRKCIEKALGAGYRKFVLFPYGYVGRYFKEVLSEGYGIKSITMVDNDLCKYNDYIFSLKECKNTDCYKDHAIIISTTNVQTYHFMKKNAFSVFPPENIFEMDWMHITGESDNRITKIGRHSYGPICTNHPLIESIGSFCSFAGGVCAVLNHETGFISTHPILASESIMARALETGNEYSYMFPEYIPGVRPRIIDPKRSVIGNDVWLGENVIITSGADIGNGVIVGAGAVITKDIPDYAVAVGVPAKVIRYRYKGSQIEALNRIRWWDWDDDTILERHDDFYLDVDSFIGKYDD